jgi:hypothetical protein
VIAVAPIDAPPCITSDGAIYEHVVGQTVPVTDPALLGQMFAAGRAAKDAAERTTRGGITRAYVARPGQHLNDYPLFVVSVTAVKPPFDRNASLFSVAFRDALARVLTTRLMPSVNHCRVDFDVAQDNLLATFHCAFRDVNWIANVGRLCDTGIF